MFRVYYIGLHRWDNYLLDIDHDIRTAGENSQRVVRATKNLSDNVQSGFEGLRTGIEGLQVGMEDLRAEFQWGFSLIADRLDTQISIMAGIAKKLDSISAALDAPLDRQARELFGIGLDRLRDGLDDKALESFLQSEQKDDVDFVLQSYIGKLYLYGRVARDLRGARGHLLSAARYAEAKKGRIEDWNQHAAEAYFHAAVAAYVEGEKALADGAQQGVAPFLEMALGFLVKAASLWPEFLEIAYTRAKCCALLGQQSEVRECFQFLSNRDRRYLLKAGDDRDFDSYRGLLKEIADDALADPGPIAQQVATGLELAGEAVSWARRGISEAHQGPERVDEIERRIADARAAFATLNVDLVGLNRQLHAETNSLGKIAEASLTSHLEAAQAAVAENRRRQNLSLSEISAQSERMRSQSGSANGWAFVAVTALVGGTLVMLVISLLFKSDSEKSAVGFPAAELTMVVAIIVGMIVSQVTKARRREPYRFAIARLQVTIKKCIKEEAFLATETAGAYDELQDFQTWRRNRSAEFNQQSE